MTANPKPDAVPPVDAEMEAAINAHEAAAFAFADIMHSRIGRKEISDAANNLRALYARRVAEAEARGREAALHAVLTMVVSGEEVLRRDNLVLRLDDMLARASGSSARAGGATNG